MGIQTKTTAPTSRYSLTSPTVISNGGISGPVYLNRARTTFYGITNGANGRPNKLNKSTDGGTTWSVVRDFDAIQNFGDFSNMLELPSGEILLALSGFGTFGFGIYKSTGWVANPATATFSNKMNANAALSRSYSLNFNCLGTNGVVLASEAGSQTAAPTGVVYTSGGTGYTTATLTGIGGTGAVIGVNIQAGVITRIAILNGGTGYTAGSFTITGDGSGASISYTVTGGVIDGSQTGKARRLYLSTDFGDNWTSIFDIYTTPSYKYGIGLHLHAVAYDEAWDRIWIVMGDDTGDGKTVAGYPTNAQIFYSDNRGSTWQNFPACAGWDINPNSVGQYTGISIFPYAVVFYPDARFNLGGIIYRKTGYRTLSTGATFAPNFITGSGQVMITPIPAFSLNNSYPSFLVGSITGQCVPAILLTDDGGYTWREIWRETDLVTRPLVNGGWLTTIMGPDTSGRILATYTGYSSFLQGVLVG